MNNLLFVVSGVMLLYVFILFLRRISWFKVCALCGAVSGTWIILIILYYIDVRIDPVLIGILMGGSIVGVIEMLSDKLPKSYQIFRLAFYATLLVVVYGFLLRYIPTAVFILIAIVWAVSLFLFVSQKEGRIGSIARHIIKCCKNW